MFMSKTNKDQKTSLILKNKVKIRWHIRNGNNPPKPMLFNFCNSEIINSLIDRKIPSRVFFCKMHLRRISFLYLTIIEIRAKKKERGWGLETLSLCNPNDILYFSKVSGGAYFRFLSRLFLKTPRELCLSMLKYHSIF